MVRRLVRPTWLQTLMVIALVLLGLAFRWWVLRSPFGQLNADEAYTGLEAREVLRGRFPVIMGGAVYTGVADAYVFAPVLALVGAHITLLKLLSSLWWALAAVGVFWVVDWRVGRVASLSALALMWVAPGPLFVLSTRAYIGYGLGMLAVVIALLAAACEMSDATTSWRRAAVLGAAAGFAFYCHPMFVAVAVPLVATVALSRLRSIREWWIPAVSAAVFVNLPFLAWNLRHGWVSLHQPSPWSEPWSDRFVRFFTGLLPRALGLRTMAGDWLGPSSLSIAAYLLLIALMVVGAVRLVRVHPSGRVFVVPLIAAWPVLALFSNLSYVDDARYAIVVWPFIASTIAAGVAVVVSHRPSLRPVGVGAPLIAATVLTVPWLATEATPVNADPNEVTRQIIDLLDDAGIDTMLGNYWYTLPVEFMSDSRIATAVAGHPWGALFEWQPGIPWGVRLPVTQAEVMATDVAVRAYVFQVGDPFLSEQSALEVLPLPVEAYTRYDLAGAMLFIPRQEQD